MIYLASPFSDAEPDLKPYRYKAALLYVSQETLRGRVIFSPIVYYKLVEDLWPEPLPSKEWLRIDMSILKRCDVMEVLCLPGWENSKGIKKELQYAEMLQIPVHQVAAPIF